MVLGFPFLIPGFEQVTHMPSPQVCEVRRQILVTFDADRNARKIAGAIKAPSTHGHGLHNLWRAQFGVDEHPFATYFDVHQGYRVLTLTCFAWRVSRILWPDGTTRKD